jgi:Tol biopolymer transport system component
MRPPLIGIAILSWALAGPSVAVPERSHDITIDDYFTLAHLTGVAFSPDGSRVAYVESRWDKEEDGRNSDLWVVDVETRAVTRLTFDPAADSSP